VGLTHGHSIGQVVLTHVAVLNCQGCSGFGDSHGYGYGMGMGTVNNRYGLMRNLNGYAGIK